LTLADLSQTNTGAKAEVLLFYHIKSEAIKNEKYYEFRIP
jgi:hypothetical protein